jgi:CRISPR/Cas system-associated exonuclease Cas4 (RecB family)
LGDQEIPSVTKIIDAMSEKQRFGYSDYHATRGKFLHMATVLDDEGKLDEETVDPVVMPYLTAWRKFKAETGAKMVESEKVVFCRNLRYAGTFDRIIEAHGRKQVLVDIKSGSPDKWHPLQVAAYLYAYAGDAWGKYDGGIVYLRKSGRYSFTMMEAPCMTTLVQDWKDMIAHYYEREFNLWT